MKEEATLSQGKKTLELIEEVPKERYQKLLGTGLLSELLKCPNPELVDRQAFQQVLALQSISSKNEFLKLISGGETLILDECDGSEGLADANDIFNWIDSDFVDYGADQKGLATGKTPVRVHEMAEDGTFAQMFGYLFGASPDGMDVARFVEQYRGELEKRCLTPHQIKNFVRKHRKWLRKDGYATFFLFESNSEFFVASVRVHSDGSLRVDVYRFEYSDVWYAENRRPVVVPQLA